MVLSVHSTPTSAVSRLDRRSLRWKLPWSFAVGAASIVGAFGVFAWLSARAIALASATTRLESALSQVKAVTDLGLVNQLSSLRDASRNDAIINALRRDGPVSDSAVRVL